MKALYLIALISCFTLWGANVSAITFNTNYNKPATTATLTTGTNGVIIDLKATTKYAYIISDPIVPGTTAQDWYITLLCANTAVDFGPNLGTISSSTYASTGANSLIGAPTNPFTDYLSLYYPYVPQKATTYDPTIATLGKTYRYTVTSFADSDYYEFDIRDMDGNYYGTTPINPQGVQTGGSGFFSYMKKNYLQFSFGLEVLNCGEAVFCVQTKEQAEANPGKCGTTTTYTASSCSSTTTCSDFVLCDSAKPFQLNLMKQCYATCPANYPQVSDVKCQDCDATCLTCIDTNNVNCLTCHEGKYQMNGKCLDSCPAEASSFFEGKCVKSCPDETKFTIVHGTNTGCYLECPSGYYQDSATTCAPCTSPCKTCSGDATTCTSCIAENPFLIQSACYESCPAEIPYMPTSTTCANKCPAGKYAKPDKTCEVCTSPCATCSGDATTCDSCVSESPFLYQSDCYETCPNEAPIMIAGSSCGTECPSGTFQDSESSCAACTSPCATCSESATRCTSCAAGYQIADTTCEQIVVAESSSESGLPGWGLGLILGLCIGIPVVAASCCICWKLRIKYNTNKNAKKQLAYLPQTPASV